MRRFYEIILDAAAQRSKGGPVLDLGCGCGNNSNLLKKYGIPVGIDRDMLPIKLHKSNSGDGRYIKACATNIPVKDETFFLVAAFNIIEHVENDIMVLRELARVCKINGSVVIVTSAFPFLWGPMDEASCHFRRYSRNDLIKKIEMVGLNVVRVGYINWFFFHLLASLRLIQRIFKLSSADKNEIRAIPKFINWLLTRILIFEANATRYINWPYGVSLFCVATK